MTAEETYRAALRAAEDDLAAARVAGYGGDQDAAVSRYTEAVRSATDTYRLAGGKVPPTPLQPLAAAAQEDQ